MGRRSRRLGGHDGAAAVSATVGVAAARQYRLPVWQALPTVQQTWHFQRILGDGTCRPSCTMPQPLTEGEERREMTRRSQR